MTTTDTRSGGGRQHPKPAIGWREWVSLPDLGIDRIKAKIDTGARTSSLHATQLDYFRRDGHAWVRFSVCPDQRGRTSTRTVEAPLADRRAVVSSSGSSELRPFIETAILIGGQTFAIDLNLTDRTDMGFRMLLGRAAIRRRFLVDPGRSYLNSSATTNRGTK